MLTIWVLGWFVLLPSEYQRLGKEIVSGSLFSLNIQMAFENGYFHAIAQMKPLLHLWSLGVEEQYYFIWPIVILVALRLRSLYKISVVLLIASFILNVVLIRWHSNLTFYLMPTRFWELLLGGMLSIAEQRGWNWAAMTGRLSRPLGALVGGGALATVLATAALLSEHAPFPGWWALIPTLTAVAIIAVGPHHPVAVKVLGNRPAVLMGRISYPLYLWHWPLLALAAMITGGHTSPVARMVIVVIAMILSWMTWRWVERPAQAGLPRLVGSRNQVLAGLAALCLVAGIGTWTWAAHGYPWRVKSTEASIPQAQIARDVGDSMWNALGESNDQACVKSRFADGAGVDYCRLTSPSPRIAIIGDSHANHLVPGLVALHDPFLSRVVQISFGGCASFGGMIEYQHSAQPVAKACYRANKRFLDEIIKDKSITTVMFSYYVLNYLNKGLGLYPAPTKALSFEGRIRLVEKTLSKTIARLQAAGKHVVIIVDDPGILKPPQDCIYRRRFSRLLGGDSAHHCRMTYATAMSMAKYELWTIARLRAKNPGLTVVNLPKLICAKDGKCPYIIDGKLIYRDSNHLSLDGSVIVARMIRKDLAPVLGKLSRLRAVGQATEAVR